MTQQKGPRQSWVWGIDSRSPEELVLRLRKWLQDPDCEPELKHWYQSQSRSYPVLRRADPWEIAGLGYFPMYEVAWELERVGEQEKALAIYLNILRSFTPCGTLYYERPAILLERMGKPREAIAICDRAIGVIRAGLFHAEVEPFQKRKMRLEKKLQREQGGPLLGGLSPGGARLPQRDVGAG